MKKIVWQVMTMAMLNLAVVGLCFASESAKILRIGMSETIRDWDPCRETGHYEPEIKNAIFEKIVTIKPGTWEVIPGVAESWKFSEDRKEITFYLKKGIKFQKGYGEITAEDVKFTLMRGHDPKWEAAAVLGSMDRVEILDNYTLKVYLKYPDSSFIPYELAKGSGGVVVPKEYEKMSVGEVRRNPIGSGPYELVTWKPMDKIVLKRFKDYHGKTPYFDTIEYSIFSDQQTLELALQKGDIDLAIISYKGIPSFRKQKDIKIYAGPSASYSWVGFNVKRSPFDDIRVREAIRYAVDVDEILQGAFEGAPKRANTMFPLELLGHWKDAPVYKPNLDKAKELMKEAGFAKGLTASMVVSTANRGDLVLPILMEQLSKIGVTIKATTVTRPAQIAELQAGNVDMYYIEYRGFAKDSFEATEWFDCEQAEIVNGWNMSKWCNKEYDDLRMKAKSTVDENEQAELYIKMQKIMDEEIPAIWIHHGLTAIAYKSYIDLEGCVNPDGRLCLQSLRVK